MYIALFTPHDSAAQVITKSGGYLIYIKPAYSKEKPAPEVYKRTVPPSQRGRDSSNELFVR